MRCEEACGGVECARCGGECDHVMQQIERARNASNFYFQQASLLQENITKILESLTLLSNTTQMILANATETKEYVEETRNISIQLTNDIQITVYSLEARLNDSRNATSRIEVADTAVLEMALPYTSDEVNS